MSSTSFTGCQFGTYTPTTLPLVRLKSRKPAPNNSCGAPTGSAATAGVGSVAMEAPGASSSVHTAQAAQMLCFMLVSPFAGQQRWPSALNYAAHAGVVQW